MDTTARRERLILAFSLLFLLCSILYVGRMWLLRATAPAPRPHAVLRLTLPGLDLGADAWPARPGATGYIEVWAEPHDAEDYQPLLQVPGAPALPMAPKPVPPPRGISA